MEGIRLADRLHDIGTGARERIDFFSNLELKFLMKGDGRMHKGTCTKESESRRKSPHYNKIAEINKIIQTNLRLANSTKCTPIQACEWLEKEGVLKSDKGRPGRPLRVLLRKGLIRGATQESAGSHWVIRRVRL